MKTGFFSLHPLSTFLFYLLQFALVLLSSNPFVLLACFIANFAFDFSIKGKSALKTTAFALPFILFCSAFNALFSHYGVTVLFVLKSGNNVTLESLVYGAFFGAKIALMLLVLECFNEIITPEKIVFLFGRISPKLALVLSMSLRFIPLLKQQSAEIKDARSGVGICTDRGNLYTRMVNAIHNVSILITWSMERAIDTANSMSARSFGKGKMSRYNPYRFAIIDGVLIAFSVIIGALILVSSQKFHCSYNPIISISMPDFVTTPILVCLFAVSLFPLIYNIIERKRWTFSNPKT